MRRLLFTLIAVGVVVACTVEERPPRAEPEPEPGPSLTPPNVTDCGDGPVDLRSSREHCGGCGRACSSTCMNGVCGQLPCYRSIDCGGRCTGIESDPYNCGGCGHRCGPGEECRIGTCCPRDGGGPARCGPKLCTVALAQIDPTNCGGCGLGCKAGNTCVEGACRCGEGNLCEHCGTDGVCRNPTRLDAENESITSIAVGTSTLFAGAVSGAERRIIAIDRATGARSVVVAQQGIQAPIVASDGDAAFAYLIDGNAGATLAGCPSGACATVATPTPAPAAIAVADGFVYWATTTTRHVERCPLTGCIGVPEAMGTLTAGTGVPRMAADGSDVYVADGTTLFRVRGDGTLASYGSMGQSSGITFDATRIFVATSSGIRTVRKVGAPTPTTYLSLPTTMSYVHAPVFDGTWIYWLARPIPGSTSDAVFRCAPGVACSYAEVFVYDVGNTSALANVTDGVLVGAETLLHVPRP